MTRKEISACLVVHFLIRSVAYWSLALYTHINKDTGTSIEQPEYTRHIYIWSTQVVKVINSYFSASNLVSWVNDGFEIPCCIFRFNELIIEYVNSPDVSKREHSWCHFRGMSNSNRNYYCYAVVYWRNVWLWWSCSAFNNQVHCEFLATLFVLLCGILADYL